MPEDSQKPEQGAPTTPEPVMLTSGGLNPLRAPDELNEEGLVALLKLAGIEVMAHWRLPNGYITSRDNESDEHIQREAIYRHHRPWILAKVPLGLVEIGPRKRVIHIEWLHTPARIIVTKDDVTKGQDHVHAYSTEKAMEYLRVLQAEFKRLAKEGPVDGDFPIWRAPVYPGPVPTTARERFEQLDRAPRGDWPRGMNDYLNDWLKRTVYEEVEVTKAMLRFILIVEGIPLAVGDLEWVNPLPEGEAERIRAFAIGSLP